MENDALTSSEMKPFILVTVARTASFEFGRHAGAADKKPPMTELKVRRTGITTDSPPLAPAGYALADT